MFLQTSLESLTHQSLPFIGQAALAPVTNLFAAMGLGAALLLTLAWMTAAVTIRHSANREDGFVEETARGRNPR